MATTKRIHLDIFEGIRHLNAVTKKCLDNAEQPEIAVDWKVAYADLSKLIVALWNRATEIQATKSDGRGRPAGNPYEHLTPVQEYYLKLRNATRRLGNIKLSKEYLEALAREAALLGVKMTADGPGKTIDGNALGWPKESTEAPPPSAIKAEPLNLEGF